MTAQLVKATRTRSKLRIGLFGAAGSGKTYSALKLARGIASSWDKVAVIDTERGSGHLYSHLGDYLVYSLEAPYAPERYIDAIDVCERAGMEVVIIDSISHEWNGAGGCLEIVDKVDTKLEFSKWKLITPRHNRFIERILQSKAHVICCGRSKDGYVLEENNQGKKVPKKVGLKAITRDGFDFEVTLAFDLDAFHQAISSKDRTSLFDAKPPFVIDETTGKRLLDWLQDAPLAPEDIRQQIRGIISSKNLNPNDLALKFGIQSLNEVQDIAVLNQIQQHVSAA